ncbi:DsrE family protein [Marinobacter daepoensis]|uniref:DsrE family protein n=1 Tax=Marinobacter daepoensis TaxID=262077 RepID=UPI00040E4F32|nr:DsrE family protein [Marinobacter daepoensis]MBY6032408.1 DsrE family protein [Marinobacter daepoensis]
MSTLIIIDQSPYGSWAGREALDMTFSLAAFDQPAALLFVGPGVHWLCQGQNADNLGQKSVEKNLSAASMFGVEDILADAGSCARYNLAIEHLISGTTLVESIRDTIAGYNQVVFAG